MRRTPIVLAATAAGLAGVLGFHTKPAHISFGVSSGTATGAAATGGSSPASTSGASAGTSSKAATPTTTAPAHASPPASAGASGTRTATGVVVNYNYGLMSVKVTASGKKITHVSIAMLDDGGNSLSQSIDQQSIPLLEQQALQAQSGNIQGVSGASYTSAGFAQSLQSALSKLGLK